MNSAKLLITLLVPGDLALCRQLGSLAVAWVGPGFAGAKPAERASLFKFKLQRQAPQRRDWVI